MNTYVQYESPNTSAKEATAHYKVFENKVKFQGQGHWLKFMV